jgi:UPF0755 protein
MPVVAEEGRPDDGRPDDRRAAEPSWDDIFRPASADPQRAATPVSPEPVSAEHPDARLSDPFAVAAAEARAAQDAPPAASQPQTRREARETAGRVAQPQRSWEPPKKKRRLGWLWALLVVFVLIIGGGVTGWVLFEPQIRHVLGWEAPIDYTTTGDGTKVTVVIQSGDIGSNVAKTLEQAGVTKTYDAFYKLLLKNPSVTFQPGSYQLQKQMSAASALAALQDPKNKVIHVAVIKEGVSAQSAFVQLASATALPVADFQAAAKNYAALGVPAGAPSIEGFLFPATYTFDPGVSATQVLHKLVSTMLTHLDRAARIRSERRRHAQDRSGVPEPTRHRDAAAVRRDGGLRDRPRRSRDDDGGGAGRRE